MRCIRLYAFEIQHVKSILQISSSTLPSVIIHMNAFFKKKKEIILDSEGWQWNFKKFHIHVCMCRLNKCV